MTTIRTPAVAGMFYPADPQELRTAIGGFMANAKPDGAAPPLEAPKAVIAPHAGYVYSGPVAASAYARIAPLKGTVQRVVLLGPSHRVGFRGIALPDAESFQTPLGIVAVDRKAVAALAELPQVSVLPAAHLAEHSIEVHLPFLQTVLGAFSLVPLVVGDAEPADIEAVLDRLWGGPETLIVVSSDLSHYHSYDDARRLDEATSKAIEALDDSRIEWDDACGRVPVAGLLRVARRRGLSARTVDLRNSGDTAGPRDRVVGYGAYVVG
jgi:AmmeMemoRadiSam system protein B